MRLYYSHKKRKRKCLKGRCRVCFFWKKSHYTPSGSKVGICKNEESHYFDWSRNQYAKCNCFRTKRNKKEVEGE